MGRKKGSTNKLSKTEKNMKDLKDNFEQKIENQEKQSIESKSVSKRTYTCPCGCEVTLNGEIGKQKIKNGFELCSSCSK